jgi:hypothetical protein
VNIFFLYFALQELINVLPEKIFQDSQVFYILYWVFSDALLSISTHTWERAVPKFVANLPITFPSSKIGRELCNKVCKYISMFELL